VHRAGAGLFAGLGSDEAAAMAAATLMLQCSHLENAWHADNLTNEFGETFEGVGTLYACGVRLCASCMVARQKIARRRAREGMGRVQLREGEKWFLVTLTVPTIAARRLSLFETMRVVYDAWHGFTKRGTWNAMARASIKGVEFTLGGQHEREGRAWDAERDGYHVHIHLLAAARWIDAGTLRREWSNYLLKAWRARGIEDTINTSDGLAVCHLRLVTNRKVRRGGSVISRDGAIFEVAKYVTKAQSFLDIPEDQLLEVAAVRRWPRMFELLGKCRVERKSKKDGDPKKKLTDYLDTKNLSSPLEGCHERRKKLLRALRPRSVPLRSLAFEYLMAGEWQRWDDELAARVEAQRSYRRGMLSQRFPLATFRTLGGARWFGLDADPVAEEFKESAAIEAESWEADMRQRAGVVRENFKRSADEFEDLERWHYQRGQVWKNGWRTEKEFEALSDGSFNNEHIAGQWHRRKALRERYEDAEIIRGILFSQGREKEWFEWIADPGSDVPDVISPLDRKA
jgi:hypothetical protein